MKTHVPIDTASRGKVRVWKWQALARYRRIEAMLVDRI
jgi:hypothetical protein